MMTGKHKHSAPTGARLRQGGYALLAALFLVVAVGLATAIAVQNARTDAQRERERQLLFVGEEFRKALLSYYAVRAGNGVQQYPKTLDDLVEDHRQIVTLRHLRRIYPDPMTGTADWALDTQNGRIFGVHSRSAVAPLMRAGFSTAESGFASARSYAAWDFTAVASDPGPTPGTSIPSIGSGSTAEADATSAPTSTQPPPPYSPSHVAQANQCFQSFVVPQGECADEPPPAGKDQYTCIQYYQALYAACIAPDQ